ncbi:MAG TPA: hypothetical protein VF363_09995 [Candidatus Eisenbacteria bacterium]
MHRADRGSRDRVTRRRGTAPLPIARVAALAATLLALLPGAARAGAGSGSASILPTNAVVAGSKGTWTITYVAAEDFAHPGGGILEIVVPAGWTPPQVASSSLPGYVAPSNATYVESLTVSGQRIRARLGGTPASKFTAGSVVSILYGQGGGPASATADTVAPATAVFAVTSDPLDTGAPASLASSPSVSLIPGVVTRVKVVDATLTPVLALSRTTDQDTTHLYLRGYDKYGNSARFVEGAWSVTGGIGSTSPVNGAGTVLTLTTVGAGAVAADSGSWADSTGVVTVSAGAYATLAMTAAGTATAGSPFAATAEARDQDGNRVVSGPGSSAAFRVKAYADSLGPAAANPNFVTDAAALSGGSWSGTLTPRRSGTFFLTALDSTASKESAPRNRSAVAPAPPVRIEIAPDTLRLVAGSPDTATVRVRDAYGNLSPVASALDLTLWTDRPQGIFQDLAGSRIFALTVPAGADSARFRFVDPQATASAGRVRAIDADGLPPDLGTAESAVLTSPAAPAGAIALAASPDTLVADGVDSSQVVSGVARDAFGNAVLAGERFTVTASAVTILTDDDAGTPGAQWTAAADGTLSGRVRAGVVKGGATVSVASERGSALGQVALVLRAGAPSGAVALVASPDSLAADSVATRTITASGLVDAQGNAVEDGEAYTVATSLGAIATADADAGTPGVQVAASGGALSFTLFGGDQLGTASVTAVSARGAASGAVAVRLVPGSVSAARSSVTAASPVPVGPPGSTATVTLRDAQDHPIPAFPADSIVVSATGGPAASVTPLAGATDASGAIAFTIASNATGTASVSAAIPSRGVVLADQPSIDFAPGPLDHYVVVGPAGPLTAGAPDTLTVLARDSFGNALPSRSGDVLRPAATTGAAALPDSVLLLGGAATIPFTPLSASPLAVRVADDSSRAVVYGPVAVSPGAPYRLIAAAPAADTLAAGDSVAVAVRVEDALGNAAPSSAVAASIVAGGGSVAPAGAVTDASGAASFTLRAGSAPGAVTLRLLASGSAAADSIRADSVSVTVIPAVAASIEIAAAGSSVVAGDFLDATVTLRDAFGNVARAATPSVWLRTTASLPESVSWAPGPGASGALDDSAASDGARYDFAAADQGIVTLRVRATRAETIRLEVSGTALPLAETGNVAVTPAPPAAVAIQSGDGQTAVVARPLPQPLRVRVRDAFGNAAPGAAVLFRAVAGGGSVDAIAGGAADSTTTSDPSGVATCDLARVGTVAGAANNAFRASLLLAPAATADFAASALADTATAIALAPGDFSLAAAGTATVTATARDAYGNAAPGTNVTLYLGAPVAGSLESLGQTGGSGTTQSGAADATGQVAVRYRAPSAAPAADSIFARGVSVAPVGIRATVGTSAIASLRIVPDATTWTAGAAARVRVQALDAFGNLAVADTATIVLGASDAVSFSPPFATLSAGEITTFATATLADTLTLTARAAAGAPSAASGPITVVPALPSGAIALAAPRTTLTADGKSSTTITIGPARDAYGNIVPTGTLLTLTAGSGSLLAADASALPGLQVATGADDSARAVLTAPPAAGADTVRAASVQGSASGSLAFAYDPPPSLAYAPGSLSPSIVTPGQAVAFRVRIANAGGSAITVGTSSVFSFGAGAGAYAASPAAPLSLAAGATDTLRFAVATVAPSLPPATYAPSLRLVGTDGTGDPFDFYLSLAGAPVHVAGVVVTAVGASPDPAPLGTAALSLVFDVTNQAAVGATIDGASLSFTQGAFTTSGVSPALPVALPALGTTRLTVTVSVPSSGIPPGTVVGSRLTASVAFGAESVTGQNAASLDFQVVSAATLVAQPAGTSPARYLRARTFGPTARVRNGGSAAVTLSRGATRLVLTRGPADSLVAGLAADAAVSGGGTADLAFDSLAVPAAATKGRYGAWLVLEGTESGQPFSGTIPLAPDSVDVLDPAFLAVQGGVSPDTVSAGQSRGLSLVLTNGGDVPYALDASTRLAVGAPVSATLAPTAAGTVPAGGSLAVSFAATPLGFAGAPGTAAVTLEAHGLEDGRPRDAALAAGALAALAPASLAFVGGSTAPDTLRAGLSYALTASIRNGGGSPFVVDPGATRLVVTDGVETAVGLGAGAPFTLLPGATAPVDFPAVDLPAALASQPYPVTIVARGTEWGLADSAAVVSPAGEVSVVEPVASVQLVGLDPGAPIQAAPEAGALRIWSLELTPLLPPGGASSAHLQSVALTVLADQAVAADPSAVLAALALRDDQGNVVAQAVPGSANPVVLAFGAPPALTGAPATYTVEATLRTGTAIRSVALRVAQGGDVRVRDDVSGTDAGIVAAGGLPFAAITSPTVTFFSKPHGYPNPFRAGREAVRISYLLAADAPVTLTIYTLLGDVVRALSLAPGAAGGARGLNEVSWDGRNGSGDLVRPGVYVARIEGGGVSERIKVGVLR